MKDIFPKGVAIHVGKTVFETKIVDLETGEELQGITAVHLVVSVENPLPRLRIEFHPSLVEVNGQPIMEPDEGGLRRLAERFGYELVLKG